MSLRTPESELIFEAYMNSRKSKTAQNLGVFQHPSPKKAPSAGKWVIATCIKSGDWIEEVNVDGNISQVKPKLGSKIYGKLTEDENGDADDNTVTLLTPDNWELRIDGSGKYFKFQYFSKPTTKHQQNYMPEEDTSENTW